MKKALTSGQKALNFAFLLGWEKGPLGQWPSSYSVKKCPETGGKGAGRNYFNLNNVLLEPREDSIRPAICLLWTLYGGTIKDLTPSFKANHIVPLFNLEDFPDVGKFLSNINYNQRKISCLKAKPVKPSSQSFSKQVGNTSDCSTLLETLVLEESNKSRIPLPLKAQTPTMVGYSCDIGSIVHHFDNLSDDEKYNNLKNMWRPGTDFVFPSREICKKARRCNNNWLRILPWLSYSKSAGWYILCPMCCFGRCFGSNASKLTKLMKAPLTEWSPASVRMKQHELKSDVHKTALLTMHKLIAVMENNTKSVARFLDSTLDSKINQNRQKLSSIIKTILLCARHNIPLRGHRDDSDYYDTDDCGSFQALLDFRVDSGDITLQTILNQPLVIAQRPTRMSLFLVVLKLLITYYCRR